MKHHHKDFELQNFSALSTGTVLVFLELWQWYLLESSKLVLSTGNRLTVVQFYLGQTMVHFSQTEWKTQIIQFWINKMYGLRYEFKDVVYRCTRADLLKHLWRFVPSSPIIIFDMCSRDSTYPDHTIYHIYLADFIE